VQFYRPTPLDPDRHRRNEFTSGDLSLDDWLRRYAGQNRRGSTAAVWVIADASHRVVCYATLSMTSVDRSASPPPLAKGAPLQVPALLIGRLRHRHPRDRAGAGYPHGQTHPGDSSRAERQSSMSSCRGHCTQPGGFALVAAVRVRPIRRRGLDKPEPVSAVRGHRRHAHETLNQRIPLRQNASRGGAASRRAAGHGPHDDDFPVPGGADSSRGYWCGRLTT